MLILFAKDKTGSKERFVGSGGDRAFLRLCVHGKKSLVLQRLRSSLALQILCGILAGLVVGPWLGTDAIVLGELGKVFITLIKTVAAPLVFFAILDALLKTDLQLKNAGRLFWIVGINAVCAGAIALTLTNYFEPGKHLDISSFKATGTAPTFITEKFDFIKTLKGYVPESFIQPFAENSIIMIVLVAVLLGSAIRVLRRESLADTAALRAFNLIEDLVSGGFRILERLLHWIIKVTPYAVFGVVARTIGEFGYSPLKGLAAYVFVGLLALSLQPLLVYHTWIRFVRGWALSKFWKAAREPVLFGVGCNSSLATLPLTLKALDSLGVSKASSRLGACVGTNFNNDGILLYEVMAVFFVAQFHGFELSLIDQLQAALICVVAAIGIAGVPEAGIVALSLVLTTVGLPLEILPLLLTVDWILARARTVVNVLADMTVSVMLDKGRKTL